MRHLGRDQPLKCAGGWQHDTPLAQPVLGACHEFVGGPALDGSRAQPVAKIGRDVTIEVTNAEMMTDAQRLRPFRPTVDGQADRGTKPVAGRVGETNG